MLKSIALLGLCAVVWTAEADVSAFDSRMAADVSLASSDGMVWRDAATLPMESKVCAETATPYGRIPADLIDRVPEGVRGMAGHSTGHYFYLKTDSAKLGVRWQCAQTSAPDPYIPPQGMYGVDIYAKTGGVWRFVKNGRLGGGPWQETCADLPGDGEREVLVYLPIRADILGVRLGIEDGKSLMPATHASGRVKPIVHYGTSIVHGGCASRPGLIFASQAARLVDAPYVNLGFSGQARLERIMADVMARAEASLFIVDPVWNCGPTEVNERCAAFVRRLHELRPATPVLLCEGHEAVPWQRETNLALKRVYSELKKDPALVAKLHYLAADGMLPADGEATHDYIHPNDYGSMQMGAVFAAAIAKILPPPAVVTSPGGAIRGEKPMAEDFEKEL